MFLDSRCAFSSDLSKYKITCACYQLTFYHNPMYTNFYSLDLYCLLKSSDLFRVQKEDTYLVPSLLKCLPHFHELSKYVDHRNHRDQSAHTHKHTKYTRRWNFHVNIMPTGSNITESVGYARLVHVSATCSVSSPRNEIFPITTLRCVQGLVQNFGKARTQNFFSQIHAAMGRFSGRIFMLLSLPVFFWTWVSSTQSWSLPFVPIVLISHQSSR